ncbi:TonB-dependent receptor [Winogradskyella maritima]|uniref:TonB-dependent receptor domain-containing protein n=1 Tax=Winogradskyella maritima TaxID=1517766 RepID=A0ABV8AEJ0_9FLAO|nr:TonB-dependent receptor [Winogradskyella maritima]
MTKLYTLLFALVTTLAFAQNTGSIAGKLIDKEFNNEPLPFANVLIKGTTTGTTSDVDGLYEFADVTAGDYVLVFSFVGYETQEIPVTVVAGKVSTVNVTMGASAASLDEVIITTTTRKESEAALLLDQKKAVEIKQSIGAEELSRKGVSDASGAVAKISGVSKQEGSSNVYVRGLGDRYLNTTMNGLTLPSNDVNKKNIDLNLFSSDIIENVSISKAYSSKFYGDFSAGNVDISSKDYKGKGFFDFGIGSSVNSEASGQSFVKSEGTSAFGFYNRYDNNPFAVVLSHGFDPVEGGTPINASFGGSFGKSFDFENGSRLSFYGTGSFENGYEYRRGSNVDYTNVEKKAFEDAEEFEYSTKTTAMANATYKFDDQNTFALTSLFINNASDKVGYFGIDGQGRNRDAILDTDQGFYQMNGQFNQNLIYVNQLTGKHNFDKLNVDWGIGYNRVNAHEPDRKRISVENYQFALDNDPSTMPSFYSNVVFDNQRYFQKINDDEFNSRLNFAYNFNDDIKLNVGYNGRSKERDFENIRYGYDLVNANTPIADVKNLNDFFTLDNLKTSENQNGLYQLRVINAVPGISNTNRPGLPENTYNGMLDVYAGYANLEYKTGDWLFVPGVRFEGINQDISYDVINLGSLGKNEVSSKETVFLPSLSVKYAPNEDQNLRLSASQTISLPEFKEVAPFVYESISQRIGGNPDLLGRSGDINYTNVNDVAFSKIFNFDLKYEWFMSKSEIFSIGGFYKQINDPVNQVVAFDATGTQRFFRTGEKAEIYGVEVELRKTILTADEDDAKLSTGFNATYMYTNQDLYESIIGTYSVSFNKSEEELQGASPFIVNADISYSPTFGNYKPTANLIFSYFSDRIDALGSGQLGNVIEKGIPTLDFILKNKLSEKLSLDVGIKNILNPTVQYFREGTSVGDVLVTSPNGKDVTDYKRGINAGFNLKYKF